MLFSGTSHPLLAEELAKELRWPLGKRAIDQFPDGEIGVRLLEKVEGREVFVMQTLAWRPNHYLMELLILVDALRRAGAASVTAVVPYLAYARQDRRADEGSSISAKLVASLLEKGGVDRMIALDLHAEQVEGFFDIPFVHLRARSLLVAEAKRRGWGDVVVVAPDLGAASMGRSYAEEMGAPFALFDKKSSILMGDVEGSSVLLVDDMATTGATLYRAAEACAKRGAKKVYAAVSHPLFVGEALPVSGIVQVIGTNSVPSPSHSAVETVTIAPMLAHAIRAKAL